MRSIRATSLEKFAWCPFQFKFEDPLVGNEEFLTFGTHLHKVVELQFKWQQDWIDMITQQYDEKLNKQLRLWAQRIHDKINELGYKQVVEELQLSYTYKDEIFIAWTFDALFIDKDGKYVLCDWKTTKSKWNQERIDSIKQYKIYSALLFNEYWIKVDRFEYYVLSKWPKMVLNITTFDIPDDCYVTTLNEMLDQYIEAELTWHWDRNSSNKCWFCNCKDKCDAYIDF